MKFRRKSEPTPAESASPETAPGDQDAAPATAGPYDESEVTGDGVERVDLGSLLVLPMPERELRLQVDEASGTVQSVLFAGPDGALEVQAFAAPRGGDLWGEVRPQIQQDILNRGGTVEEREGRFGTELIAQIPVQNAENKPLVQPSRIVGVNGARWMLRATFLGRPATATEDLEDWHATLGSIVVRRGTEAKPVGEPLPTTLPGNATRVG